MAQGGVPAFPGIGTEPVPALPVPVSSYASAPAPIEFDEPRPFRMTVPLLLAAGWGALITFSVMFLIEDGRDSGPAAFGKHSVADADATELSAPAKPRWTASPDQPDAETAPPAKLQLVNASADAVPAPGPATAAPPIFRPAPQLAYVGTWGPTSYACLSQSKRRGYLPATISESGARAGRTLCRFRNGRRDGSAWTMAADCSERGRNWSAQVRLVVDGDRLTWTSANGSSTYVRCSKRS